MQDKMKDKMQTFELQALMSEKSPKLVAWTRSSKKQKKKTNKGKTHHTNTRNRQNSK